MMRIYLMIMSCVVPCCLHAQQSVWECVILDDAHLQVSSAQNIDAPVEYCHTLSENESYNINNNGFRYTVKANQQITVEPGFSSGTFPYNSNPADRGYFRLLLGDRPDYEVMAYAPNDWNAMPLYEKLEAGMNLPAALKQRVNDFIQNPNTPNALNPFLEWDLKVKCTFTWISAGNNQVHAHTVDGFYYEPFERDLQDADFRNWHWDALPNPHPFRIRFAPDKVGWWQANVEILADNGAVYHAVPPFYFKVVPSANPGFVQVGPHGKYLTRGGSTFIPVGKNLPTPRCYDCEITNPDGSVTNWGGLEPYQITTVTPKAYLRYHHQMQSIADNGGNYFRKLVTPWATEIEFEQLGNYSNRMSNAWEMDQILEKARAFNLTMHWNLSIHYPLSNPSNYFHDNWDWDDTQGANVFGYKSTLGLNEPLEFMTNADAKKYYKQRLRYMISRWGYSTNIGIIELYSEVNNAGLVSETVVDANGVPRREIVFTPYNDAVDPQGNPNDVAAAQQTVEQWQQEMLGYMKYTMGHQQHLYAVNYAGQPGDDDESYKLAEVDVLTYNWYSREIDRYATSSKKKDAKSYEIQSKWPQELGVTKPFLHSEFGDGDVNFADCSDAETQRDMYMSGFTGLAGPGLMWSLRNRTDKDHFLGKTAALFAGIELSTPNGPWVAQQDVRKDKTAEMVVLTSPDGEQGVGMILNRTFNHFTDSDPAIPSACQDFELDEDYELFLNISGLVTGSNKLEIKGLKSSRYFIFYFDANTQQFIGATDDWGPKVRLDYPDLNANHPMLYFKMYTNGNAFMSTATDSIDFKPPITQEEWLSTSSLPNNSTVQTELEVLAYPNPCREYLYIEINGLPHTAGLQIFGIDGRMVVEQTVDNGTRLLNVSDLPVGLYHLRIVSSIGVYTQKLLVQ